MLVSSLILNIGAPKTVATSRWIEADLYSGDEDSSRMIREGDRTGKKGSNDSAEFDEREGRSFEARSLLMMMRNARTIHKQEADQVLLDTMIPTKRTHALPPV